MLSRGSSRRSQIPRSQIPRSQIPRFSPDCFRYKLAPREYVPRLVSSADEGGRRQSPGHSLKADDGKSFPQAFLEPRHFSNPGISRTKCGSAILHYFLSLYLDVRRNADKSGRISNFHNSSTLLRQRFVGGGVVAGAALNLVALFGFHFEFAVAAVLQRIGRGIAEVVLAAEFSGNLVEGLF
jgi:hypothetical protein